MLANLVTRQRGSALGEMLDANQSLGLTKITPRSLSAAYPSIFWINFSEHLGLHKYAGVI